uniref:DNA topoisomerase 3 n=1 Tax=Lygus hesperus TaxID=30085 RepID=A0A0A9XKJ5_LYGHE
MLPDLDHDGRDSLGFHLNEQRSFDEAYGSDGASSSGGSPQVFTEGDKEGKNTNESLLSAIDMLCDDLFYCKKTVLVSFARTRGVGYFANKADLVSQIITAAHEEAHGESKDLSITKRVLGDVFSEDVRTSGLRSA